MAATSGTMKLTIVSVVVVQMIGLVASQALNLGCYTKSKISVVAAPGVKATATDCAAYCQQNKWPVYGLSCPGTARATCVCSWAVPNTSARITTDSTCRRCASVSLSYITAATGCALRPVTLSQSSLTYPSGFQSDKMSFPAPGTFRLDLTGINGHGANLGPAAAYGLYTVSIRMSLAPATVGAFYLINNYQDPNKDREEVDLEFINAGKLITEAGTVWTAMHKDGTQKAANNFVPSKVRALLGDSTFSVDSGNPTYTIDWQPGYARWYVNGKLLEEQVADIPGKPAYLVMSLWSWANNGGCEWFAGCADANTRGWIEFKDLQRVQCGVA